MTISSTSTSAAVAISSVPLMSLKTSTASAPNPAGPVTFASRPARQRAELRLDLLRRVGEQVLRIAAGFLGNRDRRRQQRGRAVAEIRAGPVSATVPDRSALIAGRTRSLIPVRTSLDRGPVTRRSARRRDERR